MSTTQESKAEQPGTFLEVLAVFTRLGLTSFGGPVAHLGYFHDELVKRRGWMSEEEYASSGPGRRARRWGLAWA